MRKLSAQLNQWLPFVVKVNDTYDSLTTFSVVKTIGRILIGLSAKEQLEEVKNVLGHLVELGYLVRSKDVPTKEHYWGEHFESYEYEPTKSFSSLVRELKNITSPLTGATINNHIYGDNAQIANASPGVIMNLHVQSIEGLDPEVTKTLDELKMAIQGKDTLTVKKSLAYLADKGVDVVLALITGQFFKSN